MGQGQDRDICELLYAYTGMEFERENKVYGKAFVFTGPDGYVIGGQVRLIEYEPGQFFRIWSDAGVHVEWRPDGSCLAYRPLRFGGVPGDFAFVDAQQKERLEAAA